MARIFAIAMVVGLLPCGLAGPACAQKFKSTADCVRRCNSKWGFPGNVMGTNSWGSVMESVGEEIADWDFYIAKACGEENATSSSAVTALSTSSAAEQTTKPIQQGLGTHNIPSSSAIPTSTSLRSVASASRFTTSTTISHSTTSTHTSTEPSTTLTPETPTHTTAQPTAQPTHTTAQPTTQSNSNGDSNGSNTGNTNGSNDSGNGSNGSRASNADVQAYLNAHNNIREQHGAVPVTWNNNVAALAQEWADKCLNKHSGGTLGPLGENLAAGTGTYAAQEAVGDWTKEVSSYNPNNPQPSHFTQVVWKATTEIGCAVQTCDGIFAGFGAAQYYVCEYFPQGNVEDEFGTNVQA